MVKKRRQSRDGIASFSLSKNTSSRFLRIGVLCIAMKETGKELWKNRSFATPYCQFFEVHGSKFKPHPACNPGQTSVVCITHSMLLFRIRKGTFNRFFAFGVNVFPHICFSNLFHQIQVFLPDVSLQRFLPFCVCSALLAAETFSAYSGCASVDSFAFLAGCGMTKCFSLWTGKGVCGRVIYVIPRTVSVFFPGSASIGENGNPVVLQYLPCNPRSLICGIHSDVFYLWKTLGYIVIEWISGDTVMHISSCYMNAKNESFPVAGSMCFICKLLFMLALYKQATIRICR